MQVAEPFSDEAMLFTKELVMQREVSPLPPPDASALKPAIVPESAFWRNDV